MRKEEDASGANDGPSAVSTIFQAGSEGSTNNLGAARSRVRTEIMRERFSKPKKAKSIEIEFETNKSKDGKKKTVARIKRPVNEKETK